MLILRGSKTEYKIRLVKANRKIFDLRNELDRIKATRGLKNATIIELRETVDDLKDELQKVKQELREARFSGLHFYDMAVALSKPRPEDMACWPEIK